MADSSSAGNGGSVSSMGNSSIGDSSESLSILDPGTKSLIAATQSGDGPSLSVPMPFQNRIVLVSNTRIAGTARISGIDEIVNKLEEGTELRFVREPKNMQDHWAIKVFAGEQALGYVPADCNQILARLMDGGKSIFGELTEIEKIGTWNKLHMKVILDD